MLRLYWGLQGHGKTYNMIADAVEKMKECPVHVYTNMAEARIPEAVYFCDMQQIIGLSDGLILLDETGILMPSAFWQEAGRDMLVRLCQMRKRGLDMYYTCQRLTGTNVNLREQTNETVHCRKVGPLFFKATQQPDTKAGRMGSPRRYDPKIAALYNTFETIDRSGGDNNAAEALPVSTAVARVRAKAASRQKPKKQASLLYYQSWRGWFGDPDGLALYRQSEAVMRWLKDNGHWDEGGPSAAWLKAHGEWDGQTPTREQLVWRGAWRDGTHWADQVRAELARCAWLKLFGLSPLDAPVYCTPENPWLHGYDPVTVRRKWKEKCEDEAAIKEAKLSGRKSRSFAAGARG